MNNCTNCNEVISSNYCPYCGQPAKLKKIDKYYIIQEIGDFFFANKGLVYTTKKVFISPGKSVKQFITEDRYRFVKPITFLFIATFIYAIVIHFFNIDSNILQIDMEEGATVSPVINWLMENPRYSITIVILFVALWLKLFFIKAGYNFFEIFILLCFVTGITTLIDTVGAIIQGMTDLKFLQISSNIGIIYVTWAIGQFFNRKKVGSYIKSLLSFILGTLSFGIILLIIVMFTYTTN